MIKKIGVFLSIVTVALYAYSKCDTLLSTLATRYFNISTPVHFSTTKYPNYQKKVSQFLSKVVTAPTAPHEIAIALYDLNDDGTPEIVAYVTANGFCGAMGGCHTSIYSQHNGELTCIFDRYNTLGKLIISNHRSHGYRDILAYALGAYPKSDEDGKNIFRWINQNGYDYVGSAAISDQERVAFKNEDV